MTKKEIRDKITDLRGRIDIASAGVSELENWLAAPAARPASEGWSLTVNHGNVSLWRRSEGGENFCVGFISENGLFLVEDANYALDGIATKDGKLKVNRV